MDPAARLASPLFTRRFVGAIVRSFASFLDLDKRSKACSTLRYSRACVEIDVTKDIPKDVKIDLPDGRSFWQAIEIEGNLHFCVHCKIHGHTLVNCRKKKQFQQVVSNVEESAESARLPQPTKSSAPPHHLVNVPAHESKEVRRNQGSGPTHGNQKEKFISKETDPSHVYQREKAVIPQATQQETAYMTNSNTGHSLNAAYEWTVVQKRKGKKVDLHVHHDVAPSTLEIKAMSCPFSNVTEDGPMPISSMHASKDEEDPKKGTDDPQIQPPETQKADGTNTDADTEQSLISKDEEMTDPNSAVLLYMEPQTSEQVDDPKPSKPVERFGDDVD